MSNFDPNAILRGAQLTFVGAYRALQNPNIFKHEHYKQAAFAVAAGILIRVIIEIPVIIARTSIWMMSHVSNLEASTWDESVIEALTFLQHSVLQVPLFLMTLMRYLSPALDNMFMEALHWVDTTYLKKHKSEDPQSLRAMYYPNLKMYSAEKRKPLDGLKAFLIRSGRKAILSLTVYLLSYTPVVGKFVLPIASFYTFKKAVGSEPAVLIFASGLVVPKRYLVKFLQAYFSSRSLMRDLLEPYFSRIQFDKKQKRAWFLDREGVLFGFGVGFFLMVKVPIVGVLVYGIAEASTAYLITKVTNPPPPPGQAQEFKETEIRWKNKKEFLSLPLDKLDAANIITSVKGEHPQTVEIPKKQFT